MSVTGRKAKGPQVVRSAMEVLFASFFFQEKGGRPEGDAPSPGKRPEAYTGPEAGTKFALLPFSFKKKEELIDGAGPLPEARS